MSSDNIVKNYIGDARLFHPDNKTWRARDRQVDALRRGRKYVKEETNLPISSSRHWSETPYRLASANVRAEFLSVPELRNYLHFNSDFPATLLAPFATHLQYRLALPWTCLVMVFIAAPLGIGYSRRGVLSSVAASIILVFSMNFLTHLVSRTGRGFAYAGLDRGLAAEHPLRVDRVVSSLFALHQSRRARL